MDKISFKGIEDKIGREISIVLDVGNRQVRYSNLKLIGVDSEHLIFEEEKGRSFVSKNRITNYN